MSQIHGSRIITDGLVLYMDAANTKSYPGSGASIYDLSGNGNTGTLVNGVGYSTDNCGCLTFDGVDDYVQISETITFSKDGSTIIIDFKLNDFPDVGEFYGNHAHLTGVNDIYRSYISVGSSGQILAEGNVNNNYWISTSSGTVQTGLFYRLTVVAQDSIVNSYLNDVLVDADRVIISNMPLLTIGGNSTDQYIDGVVSTITGYNRALSPTEISQNYNALKGRYGL